MIPLGVWVCSPGHAEVGERVPQQLIVTLRFIVAGKPSIRPSSAPSTGMRTAATTSTVRYSAEEQHRITMALQGTLSTKLVTGTGAPAYTVPAVVVADLQEGSPMRHEPPEGEAWRAARVQTYTVRDEGEVHLRRPTRIHDDQASMVSECEVGQEFAFHLPGTIPNLLLDDSPDTLIWLAGPPPCNGVRRGRSPALSSGLSALQVLRVCGEGCQDQLGP